MSEPDWSRAFDDPIALPDGREMVTLRDAAEYVQALPKAARLRRLQIGRLLTRIADVGL